MVKKLKTKIKQMENITDTAKVAVANMGAIGLTFSDIENGLKLFSLVLAIAYTIWKFKSDINKKKKADKCAADCKCHE